MLARLPAARASFDGVARERLAKLIVDGEAWLGGDPGLAELGHWMLDAKHAVELRRQGCAWLAHFPTVETVKLLTAVALEPSTPPVVREQAIWTLGDRQLRGMHPLVQWSSEAVQRADETLVKLAWDAAVAGKIASEVLPHALRHVASDGIAAVFARAPGLWGEALECFATPPLARVLSVSIDDLPPQHRIRALRLVAATLGAEALPILLSRVPRASVGEQLETLFLALAFGGEVHLGKLEDVLRGMKFSDLLRARARWHLQHRGVVPTVNGLRIARATATFAPAERTARCAAAADALGALTRFERHVEAYLYAMWGWMVRGAGDPARARELVAAHPESQELVRELYLEDLARRGRVKQLTAAAQTLRGAEQGALALAIWGRPLAALELAATARHQTPELVCARALACYRAGRPDLTDRILAEDLPPSEITDDESLKTFPGPNERWLIDHPVDRTSKARAAVAALAGGRAAIVALAQPAAHDAEPDPATLEPLAAVERRLGRGLPGATVYLAGELPPSQRAKVVAAIEAAGARLVAGPFPGTDYYVHGDACLVQTIAQLERQGARRLRALEEAAR